MKYFKNGYIASDHAGKALKDFLVQKLENIVDLGPFSDEPVDYPDYAKLLADRIDNESFGILICGSGIGMSIAANRFKHIRAALCHSEEYAKLGRMHNNANVLVLGARFISEKLALELVNTFLSTPFEEGRHKIRIDKLC